MKKLKLLGAQMQGFHGGIFLTAFVILLAAFLPYLDSQSAPERVPSDPARLYEFVLQQCPDAASACLEEATKKITAKNGPEAALSVLARFQEAGTLPTSSDDHQFAHEVGRQTAKTFGISAKSFLSCPTTFNYGCQHGFFEYVLGRTKSTKEAAALICGAVESDPSYSDKFKFYCYHGLGHGVMMAQAYDLDAALATCDSLGSDTAQGGCWQGMFMENVNAGMRGEAREGVFSEKDPLAPCDRVADRYRYQCYINHSGYLMTLFHNYIGKASLACTKAGEFKTPCFQSMGLLTTNPSWQTALGNYDVLRNVDFAVSLCGKFPKEGRTDCFIGALDNITNYDEMNLEKRAIPFCEATAASWGEDACYRQIGINVLRQVAEKSQRRDICNALRTDKGRMACATGAGL